MMKLAIRRAVRRTAFAATVTVLGGCAAPAMPDAARDVAAMTTAVEASAAAWNRGDLKGHLAIYDESVAVMTRDGPRPTIAAIEASFSRTCFDAGGQPKQMLRVERTSVRMLSSDSALMTGRFVLEDGGPAGQSGWFTLVWMRRANGWRVVHDHTS